ncbi:MAG: VOC family protein [Myxococcaceae bacterium]
MLGDNAAEATVAVKDLGAARKFYEQTLGLKPVHEEGEEAIEYQTGRSALLVYRSQFAGTNKATAVTWMVPDVESSVRELKSKGVRFEHYDLPQSKLVGDVHMIGDQKAAWFTDPDGNILALVGH